MAVSATVRYDAHGEWFFGEHRRRNDGADSLVIKRNDLAAATATDLARALRAARRHDEEPYAVNIDLAPDDEYSPKSTVVDPISFKLLDDGRLAIRISLTSDDNFEDQNRLYVVIEPLIDPLLRRSAGQLVAVGVNRSRTTALSFMRSLLQRQHAGRGSVSCMNSLKTLPHSSMPRPPDG